MVLPIKNNIYYGKTLKRNHNDDTCFMGFNEVQILCIKF